MTPQIMDVVRACTRESDAGRRPFPDVIAALLSVGVERYHADLIRSEKIYYLPDGDSLPVDCAHIDVVPADAFDAEAVAAAIRAAQAGAIDYRTFCNRVAAAGCAGYHVSLHGRRAVYYGRSAEMHVEHFPN